MRLLLLALLLGTATAHAQPQWRGAPSDAVSLDLLLAYDDLPGFEGDVSDPVREGAGSVAGVVQLSARRAVGERLTLYGEAPIAVIVYTGDYFTTAVESPNRVAVGNPLLGAAFAVPAPRGLAALSVGADVRLPLATASDLGPFGDASTIGGIADRLRPEAYAGRTTALHAYAAATVAPAPDASLTASLGPVASYALDQPETDTGVTPFPGGNLALLGSLVGTARTGALAVGGGIAARYEPDGGWLRYDRSLTLADATLHAALEGFAVRPGLQVVVPLTPRYTGTPGAVFGLSLDVPLP